MDPSVRSRAISSVLRLGVRPILHRVPGHPGGIRTARSTVDAASLLMRPGSRVRVLPLHDPQLGTGRDERPVTGERVVSRDAGGASGGTAEGAAGGAVLYLHGGGYVVCSPRTHRPITSRLALDSGLPVLVPRYRLAPEHPFPAPLEDALAAYRRLLARGVPAARVALAGDSADGHLAEALADALKAAGANCELQIWKGQMHVFQILNRVLPEAAAAMRDAGRFIRSVTAPAAAERPEAA